VKLYEADSFPDWIYQYISENLDDIAQTDEFKCLSKLDFVLCLTKAKKHPEDTSRYKALMLWIKYDEQIRKRIFAELFRKVLNLKKILMEFIKEHLLQEQLIISNVTCHQLVLAVFSKQLEKKSNDLARETSIQSKVISLGGIKNHRKVNDVYNLHGQALVNYPDLPVEIESHCSLQLNNHIYCVGGKSDSSKEALNDVWQLSLKIEQPKWKKMASMNEKRSSLSATVHEGSLVVAGGKRSFTLDSAEIYDVASDKWKRLPSMQQCRYDHALVSCGGKLYALGGDYSSLPLSSVEQLKNLGGQWEDIMSMQKSRSMFAAVNCNGVIFAIGGASVGKTLKCVERYEADSNTWSYVHEMHCARMGHSACVLNGKIYVVGGAKYESSKLKVVSKIECYDPSNDTWTIVGATDGFLVYHSVVAA